MIYFIILIFLNITKIKNNFNFMKKYHLKIYIIFLKKLLLLKYNLYIFYL